MARPVISYAVLYNQFAVHAVNTNLLEVHCLKGIAFLGSELIWIKTHVCMYINTMILELHWYRDL